MFKWKTNPNSWLSAGREFTLPGAVDRLSLSSVVVTTGLCLLLSASNSPGLVMEWQQSSTSLYFSGATRYIRLYDLNKETKVIDMITGSDGVVTSMCCDALTESRIIGSFSDGSVRVFDKRLPPHER